MSATRRTSVVGKKGKQAAPEEPAESPEAVALRAAQQQVSSLQEALRSSTAKLEEREAENSTLQQELKSSKSKTSEMHRSLAKRLMHIAMLERTIEEQKRKEQTLTNELVKHTQMLDQVMNFRDKESAREFNELLQENAELTEKCERWKERAKELQQERWGFVQKFRSAQVQARQLGHSAATGTVVADPAKALTPHEDGASDDDDDDQDGNGSDDDW